ncbi:MAG: DUF222 domain-containing protein [Actinomycetes bacterium]
MFESMVRDDLVWMVPDEVPDWLAEPDPNPSCNHAEVAALLLEWVAPSVPLDADEAAAEAQAMPPGSPSARLVESIVVGDLSEQGRVDFAQACERLAAWAAARQLPAIVDHIGRNEEPDRAGNERAFLDQSCWLTEMQVSLNLSETALRSRLSMARALTGPLSGTYERFLAGDLSFMHVRAIVETADGMRVEHVAELERRVLARASGKTIGELRRLARTVADRLDVDAATRRHAQASRDRSVQRWHEPDGVAALMVRGPATDIEAVWAALSTLAGPRAADDPRRLDARRFDALLGLCLGAVAPRDEGEAAGPVAAPRTPVQAQIVIDLATLLELADNPCELRGYGAIPAEVARGWLQQAKTWRRLVSDPVTGQLLDVGPVTRFAPPRLRRFVTVRDQTCTFPQCQHPAARCDLDHDPPWRPDGSGGRTSSQQLAALCRRHHRLKTFGGWSVEEREHGRTVWRSPSGRVLTADVAPVLGDG